MRGGRRPSVTASSHEQRLAAFACRYLPPPAAGRLAEPPVARDATMDEHLGEIRRGAADSRGDQRSAARFPQMPSASSSHQQTRAQPAGDAVRKRGRQKRDRNARRVKRRHEAQPTRRLRRNRSAHRRGPLICDSSTACETAYRHRHSATRLPSRSRNSAASSSGTRGDAADKLRHAGCCRQACPSTKRRGCPRMSSRSPSGRSAICSRCMNQVIRSARILPGRPQPSPPATFAPSASRRLEMPLPGFADGRVAEHRWRVEDHGHAVRHRSRGR